MRGRTKRVGKEGGSKSEFVSLETVAALPNYSRTYPSFLPHFRQFASPPPPRPSPRDFCLSELWYEDNISITIKICMSKDFAHL